MSFDLRARYAFDPTESQIAEGYVSPYGQANSHANCVPASFTTALVSVGYPDIDPEQIIVDEYGIGWRGGTQFWRSIGWITARFPSLSFTNTEGTPNGFDFDIAEAAGQAGKLIIIAGWVDNGPTFNIVGEANGLSHASLLVAHNPDDTFVIWNVWRGRFETYGRQTIAETLYDMSVMTITGGDDFMNALTDAQQIKMAEGVDHLVKELGVIPLTPGGVADTLLSRTANLMLEQGLDPITGKLTPGSVADVLTSRTQQILDAVKAFAPTSNVEVLAAIADLKAHPTVLSDPSLLAAVLKVDAHFSGK